MKRPSSHISSFKSQRRKTVLTKTLFALHPISATGENENEVISF
jgi:hypothetical protein